MRLIADLHLHSKYSRAVSSQMVIPEIAKWAKRKGIGLVGTSDWTHPLWLRELKGNLEEAGEGVYSLKKADLSAPLFLLSTEISSIYSQGGRTRRIHNLVLAPSLETVEKINAALRSRGANLLSDGRPIIGLSAKDLAELVLSIDKNCLVIPCHVWTPWYSLYGSNSGFDSIEECFGDLSDQIYAVETGLSSDPAMNWRIEELDNRSILSFSDAHSPAKLGREATVFEFSDKTRISYQQIREAIIRSPADAQLPRITHTFEFYPEEGKYHWTGHRNCEVKQSPEESRKLGVTCPVCGKKLTVGVSHRVQQLAGREVENEKLKVRNDDFGTKWIGFEKKPSYAMLVPFSEILAEALNVGVSSQTVQNEYHRLTASFGSEFRLLLKTAIEEIAKVAGEKVAEGIKKVREGDVFVDPGYDGVFGKVEIWGEEEKKKEKKQLTLFLS